MSSIDPYRTFIEAKIKLAPPLGFDVPESEISPILKGHQKAIVRWAVLGGCRAIFAAFGLGKTLLQLETLRLILARAGGRGLIIAPLGVRQEFIKDSAKLGVSIKFIRSISECTDDGLYITNYETVRDGKLDPNQFTAASLDEAAILRSYGSLTYQTFLTLFDRVRFRFVATATPDPNRHKELIHYAGFLGIMDTGAALTRWFKRDSTKANNLTLYEHKAQEFWMWVNSWAIFLQKPSALGFSDEGYDLPPLHKHVHEVSTIVHGYKFERDGQGKLLDEAAGNLQTSARVKRESVSVRIAKMMEIITGYLGDVGAKSVIGEDGNYIDQIVIWCDLNEEQTAAERALKAAGLGYSSIYGALKTEECERRLEEWRNRKTYALIGKPVMLGSGLNLQQCNKAVFVGVTYKFNDVVQAAHRIYRFLQTRPCELHFIHADTERQIWRELEAKWMRYNEQVAKMTEIIKEHGLNNLSMAQALTRSIGIDRIEARGDGWMVANNDTVDEGRRLAENSLDLIVTSIPFCYDEETEVLTRRGWLGFDKVDLDSDELATVSQLGKLEYQRPSNIVWQRYEGEMIKFTGRSFNLLVTPNHRMYAARRGISFSPDKFEFVTANQIATEYEDATRKSDSGERILRGWRMCLVPPARGDGKRPDKITIPSLPAHIRNGHGVQLYWIETKDFMRLAGWYLSEGHADSFDEGRCGGRISIGQDRTINAANYSEIEELMVRIGLPPSLSENQISVWCRNLAHFMQVEFGHLCENKRIPRWVMELHPDLLEIMRDAMMKGDGSKSGDSYASISRELRDSFQEVCLKTGWRASTNETKVVYVGSAQTYPEIRHIPERVPYSGMIGCATVPNGSLIVRRGGQPCVSGNSNHYEYTPSLLDFGHTETNGHFWEQMDYLTPELKRALKPGRIACIHVKDRILFGNVTGHGVPTLSPFHAETISHFQKHGFQYLALITVVTDVVRENNQTYRLGYTEMCKDGSKMGVGSPEYIVIVRKPQTDKSKAYADTPVTKRKKFAKETKAEIVENVEHKDGYSLARWQIDAHAFWRSSGDRLATPDELAMLGPDRLAKVFTEWTLNGVYDYEAHVRIGEALELRGALPSTFMALAPGSNHSEVWHDINRMRTLNGAQSAAGREQHVCPLQVDIVDRLIERYSMRGELVYDPFGGLFTVPYRAMKLGRKGRAVELNHGYFLDGIKYLQAMEREISAPSLFDVLDNMPTSELAA